MTKPEAAAILADLVEADPEEWHLGERTRIQAAIRVAVSVLREEGEVASSLFWTDVIAAYERRRPTVQDR